MRKAVAYLIIVAVLCAGALYCLSYVDDKKSVEEAILLAVNVDSSKVEEVEKGYARARSKALSIRSGAMRERALAEIERVFQGKKKVFVEAEQLKQQALALMNQQHSDALSLRESRLKAEALAAKIKIAKEAAVVVTSLRDIYKEQSEAIAAEERRRAEEELALRLQAERQVQDEQQRSAALAVELENQRQAALAAQHQRSAPPEPTDCCCKTKVDVGFLLPKYEFQYRRLSKGKCANPSWLDSHKEGWCVPDSYCH